MKKVDFNNFSDFIGNKRFSKTVSPSKKKSSFLLKGSPGKRLSRRGSLLSRSPDDRKPKRALSF